MMTSLKLENFRGFTDLTISPLKRVNLIAGANNTGKTGILEGLYLLLMADSNQAAWLPSVFRSNVSGQPNSPSAEDFPTFWQSLFYDKLTTNPARVSATTDAEVTPAFQLRDTQNNVIEILHEGLGTGQNGSSPLQIKIAGQHQGIGRQSTTFQIHSGGGGHGGKNPFATPFIVLTTRLEHPTRDADLYNQVTLQEGGEEKLLGLLREVDPRLQKLRYAKAPGTKVPLVYAHFGLKNALSMTQTGQGFSKLFSLFCQMLVSKAKVLLIDEIENGLYYETLPEIWKGIATLAASEDIQVFATTHSRECIVAAHATITKLPQYDFALHRLQRVKGRIEAVTHDQQMLEVAIKSGMEVR
jgi:hypothetical protein